MGSSDMCFVVDIQLDYEVTVTKSRRTPQQHLIECLERARHVYFPLRGDPSVTIDAAFGGTKMVKTLYLRGWLALASLNTGHEKSLVQVCANELPPKAYRLITRKYGDIYLQTMVYHALRQEKKEFDEFGDKIRNPTKQSTTVAHTTSLFRPIGLPLPSLVPRPPGSLPRDTLSRVLDQLDKSVIYDLALYKHALICSPDEKPQSNWSSEALLASFASVPVEDVLSLPPLVDNKRRTPGDSEELLAVLRPHQRRVNEFQRHMRVMQQCRVEGCDKSFRADTKSQDGGGFLFCDKCWRYCICPHHIKENTHLVTTHEEHCLDVNYQVLKEQATQSEDMMDTLREEYANRPGEPEEEEGYRKRLRKMTKAQVIAEGTKIGAFTSSHTIRSAVEGRDKIQLHLATKGETTDQLRKATVGEPSRPGLEPLPMSHHEYVDTFNFVDRFNGQFYQIYFPYQVGKAGAVFQNDLTTCLLVNAHVFHVTRLGMSKKQLPIKEFIREVSLAKLKTLTSKEPH